MTRVMEHCEDKGLEQCDDKSNGALRRQGSWNIVITRVMEFCDEFGHGSL